MEEKSTDYPIFCPDRKTRRRTLRYNDSGPVYDFCRSVSTKPDRNSGKKYFTELLNFAKEHFDYVLLDCAPIGAAIDAAVIAKHCDGAILVIAQGMASGRLIQTVKKQMEASGVRVLGAVLNKVRMKKSGYEGGYYGGYYGSYYGNYGEHHEKNA